LARPFPFLSVAFPEFAICLSPFLREMMGGPSANIPFFFFYNLIRKSPLSAIGGFKKRSWWVVRTGRGHGQWPPSKLGIPTSWLMSGPFPPLNFAGEDFSSRSLLRVTRRSFFLFTRTSDCAYFFFPFFGLSVFPPPGAKVSFSWWEGKRRIVCMHKLRL